MTYSIVARDPSTGAFGVATATGGPCVGALVPHVRSGVGAIATQGNTNPLYGIEGMALLKSGLSADEVVRKLVAADEGRDTRQLIVIGLAGAPGQFTGASTETETGSVLGENHAVAGNMLASQSVLSATADAFEAAQGNLADRLMAAMQAGGAEGGDKRGTKSAAILVFDGQAYASVDCRVDFSEDALGELATLVDMNQRGPYADFLRGRPRT